MTLNLYAELQCMCVCIRTRSRKTHEKALKALLVLHDCILNNVNENVYVNFEKIEVKSE